MSVKIRLSRVGKRSKPHYRIVVCETRSRNKGDFLEILGFINPLENPPKVVVNQDRLKYWKDKGAKPTKSLEHHLV